MEKLHRLHLSLPRKFYLNEKNKAIIAMTTENPTPIPKIILLPSTFTKILDHIEIKF